MQCRDELPSLDPANERVVEGDPYGINRDRGRTPRPVQCAPDSDLAVCPDPECCVLAAQVRAYLDGSGSAALADRRMAGQQWRRPGVLLAGIFTNEPQHTISVTVGLVAAHLAQQLRHSAPLPPGVHLAKLRPTVARLGRDAGPQDAAPVAVIRPFVRVGDAALSLHDARARRSLGAPPCDVGHQVRRHGHQALPVFGPGSHRQHHEALAEQAAHARTRCRSAPAGCSRYRWHLPLCDPGALPAVRVRHRRRGWPGRQPPRTASRRSRAVTWPG
jgi:hypothetical protein